MRFLLTLFSMNLTQKYFDVTDAMTHIFLTLAIQAETKSSVVCGENCILNLLL